APTELRSGDRVKVGTTTLRFEQPEVQATVVRPRASDPTAVRSAGPVVTAVRRAEPGGPPPAPAGRGRLLTKIANLSSRRPGRQLVAIGVFVVIAGVFGAPVAGMMHANDPFNDPGSQTVKVKKLIGQATGELPGAAIIA